MTTLSIYHQIGEQAGVKQLVNRFYELMDSAPQFAEIRQMHPADLATSNDKLFTFLCGWLGGPALYVEKYGQPMLRYRHLPFPINHQGRDQWVACMVMAMEDVGLAADVRQKLTEAFWQTADFMRNREEAE